MEFAIYEFTTEYKSFKYYETPIATRKQEEVKDEFYNMELGEQRNLDSHSNVPDKCFGHYIIRIK